MAKPGKQIQEYLPELKKMVSKSHSYFKDAYRSFWEDKNFVCRTAMNDPQRKLLASMGKPDIECNIIEAPISRLLGEFSKQEPSIEVGGQDDVPPTPEMVETIRVVEGHIRHIVNESNKDGCEYNVYRDQLTGGFSVMKVITEYVNPMSFNQVIKLKKCFDPTLCGFDPLAQHSHKGDGQYCFEIYPKSRTEFKEENPGVDTNEIKFLKAAVEGEFNWSYKGEKNDDVLLVCDLYKRKKKKVKLFSWSDGKSRLQEESDEFQEQVNSQAMLSMEAPPMIIDTRSTEIETICRYRIIENQVIDYVETDYPLLPLIFVDGNSTLLRENYNASVTQYTRSYIHHAKGIQKLKNYALQCMGGELQNTVSHKWIMSQRSLPNQEEYLAALTNNQIPSIIIYTDKDPNDGSMISPPMPVMRTPIPQEIMQTIQMCDASLQVVLGSYDASLGINDNQLSGIAIVEGATQSNAAAMPYIVGFLQALDRAAQIIVAMIPKYVVTPRTIPVVDKEGKKTAQMVNQQGSPDLKYDQNMLQVKVEAGVNFAVQKSRALNQLITLAGTSKIFDAFINSDGLPILIDNMEIRGVDQLKLKAEEFIKKMEQEKQAAAQAAQQGQANNPMVQRNQIEMQKLQQKAQQDQADNQIKASQQKIEEVKAATDRMNVMLAAEEAKETSAVRREQMDTEKMGKAVDLTIAMTRDHREHESRGKDHHRKDVELAHQILTTHEKSESANDESR